MMRGEDGEDGADGLVAWGGVGDVDGVVGGVVDGKRDEAVGAVNVVGMVEVHAVGVGGGDVPRRGSRGG